MTISVDEILAQINRAWLALPCAHPIRYSMLVNVLNDVVTLLNRGRTPGLLGIEGLPYAGKTSLVNRLADRYGLVAVPEHTVFDPSLEHLARAPWPTDEESVLQRQREFLRVEVRRSRVATVAQAGAIMDRTLLSVIAHLYLRTRRLQNGDGLLSRFLDECTTEIDRRNIVIAQSIVFLPATPKLVLMRARRAIHRGDQRMTEPFLLRRRVLADLNDFYRKLAVRLPGQIHTDHADELARTLKA